MGLLRPCLALQNNPFLGQVYLFHFKPHNSFYLQGNLCHILLWPQIFPTMTFKPHFWTITILSLIFITFRVSHFSVSHLTYKTVKLGLQNTINMSKTTRVYFGVLQFSPPLKEFRPRNSYSSMCMLYITSFLFMSFTEVGA